MIAQIPSVGRVGIKIKEQEFLQKMLFQAPPCRRAGNNRPDFGTLSKPSEFMSCIGEEDDR